MKRIKLLALGAITSLSLLFAGCGSKAIEETTIQTNDKPAIESRTTQVTPVDKTPSEDSSAKESQTTAFKDSEVHFINTGNSDAILIKGEKTVLIDGGDNDDESSLVTYLKKNDVKKIDYLIATHNHADHIGALDSVVDNIEVNQVLVSNGDGDTKTYKDFITSLSNKKLKPSVPLANAKFDLGNGAYMQVFNTNGGFDTNEESLVTLYINGEDKFLFTGDAEESTENEILSLIPDVDVLKVGHHGSKSSTAQNFLDKVNPEYAVITVGSDNKYNHPHKVVMDRLEDANLDVHRTDECGDIIFKSTGNGVKTDCKEGTYSYRDGKEEAKKETVKNNTVEETKEPTTSKPSVDLNKKPSTDSSSNSNNSSSNEPTETIKPDPTPAPEQGKMVWLSATGEKYHSINNCGRMNPSKARQVSLSDAQSQGFEDCSKC
ncbi:MAG: ComEC/Rec2 family competence protein [Sarcina sp.]